MVVRRGVSSRLSNLLVDWLVRERGMSQEEVAEMLEVSAGFVSRVRSGERRLTVDHLETMSQGVGLPLGAMLLAAMPEPTDKPEVRAIRELVVRLLENGDKATEAIRRSRKGLSSLRGERPV
jgi:transcriptional regulator with XRE-family HTH domain